MRFLKATLRNESGIILMITLLLLALLMATSVGVISSTQTNLKISGNLKFGRQAFYIADAGVHRAWRELDNGDRVNDFEDVWSGSVTFLYRNEAFGGGSHTVAVEKISEVAPRRIRIISTGCFPAANPCPAGHSKAVIESHFKRGPLFPAVVAALEEVGLSGGAITDSFDSRVAPYDPAAAGSYGDLRSNERITLSGNTTAVNGSAIASEAVTLVEGAKIAGETARSAPSYRFPQLRPCGPPYSNGAGISGGSYSAATGRLEGQPGESIVLADGSYCLSSINLSEGSVITVSGPVVVQLDSPSRFARGGLANTTGRAENFRIFSNLSHPTDGITLSGGPQAYATVYAPQSRIEFMGGDDFFGAVVGKTVVSTGGMRFHYDRKLNDNEDGSVQMIVWKDAL
jgi:predicted outer membrane repeat protein